MQTILIGLASAGFGVLAWFMLVISDWLLGDPTPSKQRDSSPNRIQKPAIEFAYRSPLEPQLSGLHK